MHAARGYSLGAVDYILAPVVPEVLRTKVAVFVDLFRKTEQVKRQAESLRRRAAQLQKLAAASVAINGALSIEQMLQTVTDTARDIIGAHQAITLFLVAPRPGASAPPRTRGVASFSDKYADWRGQRAPARRRSPTTARRPEPHRHAADRGASCATTPTGTIVSRCRGPARSAAACSPPRSPAATAPTSASSTSPTATRTTFTDDDEAILVQLAQMASIAIENTLYAEEREANRLKDEFLATLSHELRTPLNAILGWTQLLQMEGAERRGRRTGWRSSSATREPDEADRGPARRLAHHHRQAAAERAGRSQLGPVVAAAVDAVRPAVEAKQIALDVRPRRRRRRRVPGDPDRLQQVFWNLLSQRRQVHARRRAHRGRARATPAAARVRLRVTDSGAGIDPKFLPYVFDRFRQADSSSTRSHGGLGIGLTIVRHIVELHGGTRRAPRARGEGTGSTFTVTLPARPAPTPPTQPRRAPPTASPPSDPPPTPRPRAPRRRPPPRRAARRRRRRADLERRARAARRRRARRPRGDRRRSSAAAAPTSPPPAPPARRSTTARRAARRDVLVSDIAMPDEDGYALIRQLRSLPADDGGADARHRPHRLRPRGGPPASPSPPASRPTSPSPSSPPTSPKPSPTSPPSAGATRRIEGIVQAATCVIRTSAGLLGAPGIRGSARCPAACREARGLEEPRIFLRQTTDRGRSRGICASTGDVQPIARRRCHRARRAGAGGPKSGKPSGRQVNGCARTTRSQQSQRKRLEW